jgi:hypothetical protein
MAPSGGAGLGDSGKPAPDQQTVVLVNAFCAQTAEMLNAVSSTCERKLAGISTRMRGVETRLRILEAKLESVPLEETAGERDERPRDDA